MHYLGKTLAFLVVIAAIAASLLTAKLIMVRNSWTAKAVASKNKVAELQPKIETLEAQINSLRGQLFRSRELWGTFWNNVPTDFLNQNEGTLRLGIGTDQGIGDKLLLHGFEVAGDGSTIYRGSFTVVAVQNASANVKPNWRVIREEARKWQPGNWRWRNMIPSGHQENFERQELAIIKHEETLSSRVATLNLQKDLLKKANEALVQREAELVGGEVLGKAANVQPEFREGLVAAYETAEEERNQILKKIDELRHKVRDVQADIEQLQTDNIELSNRLPEKKRRDELTQKTK